MPKVFSSLEIFLLSAAGDISANLAALLKDLASTINENKANSLALGIYYVALVNNEFIIALYINNVVRVRLYKNVTKHLLKK
jgi:hypothetical protein